MKQSGQRDVYPVTSRGRTDLKGVCSGRFDHGVCERAIDPAARRARKLEMNRVKKAWGGRASHVGPQFLLVSAAILSGALAISAGPPPPADVGPPPRLPPRTEGVSPATGPIAVTVIGDLLTVSAHGADLRDVFAEIAGRTGIEIKVDEAIAAAVTVEVKDSRFEAAVKKILQAAGEENFALEYSGEGAVEKPSAQEFGAGLRKMTVLRRGVATKPKGGKETRHGPTEDERRKRVMERDRERREFFEEMEKKDNKFAVAITEYFDPGTSERRKEKLRAYIRQASVGRPEDKQTLKAAAVDRRFYDLLSDIELALLHGIQDKPEEGDKDFILELLERDIQPGWLTYAMLTVPDQRYVPFLLRYAAGPPAYEERDPLAIEIIGGLHMKGLYVREAIPILEEALMDKDYGIRNQAVIALRFITGKTYDYKIQK